MTDQMVSGRVAALREERRGYESRLARAKESGDQDVVSRVQARLDAVDAELERWSGEKLERRPAGRGKQTRVKGGGDDE